MQTITKYPTLASIKRALAVPGTVVTLVEAPTMPAHKNLNVPRKVMRLQTNAVKFEPVRPGERGAWLQLDQGAEMFVGTDDGFWVLEDMIDNSIPWTGPYNDAPKKRIQLLRYTIN